MTDDSFRRRPDSSEVSVSETTSLDHPLLEMDE